MPRCMIECVETRYATHFSGESPKDARARRALERTEGVSSRVVVRTYREPGVERIRTKGQVEPIDIPNVPTHHPNCRNSAERPSQCDCRDMEWLELGRSK